MNALFDQHAGNMASGSWWNPSRAINAGLSASSFAPSGISQLLNLGYGGYNGFKGLTSQNNEGFWGQLDPTEPGMLQNAGNWLGSGIANLLGYGNPDMGLSQGGYGSNNSTGSSMSGGTGYTGGSVNVTPAQTLGYSGGFVNVTPMQLDPNGGASDAQLHWLNSGGYGGGGGGGGGGVGYAPGADFMTGFGSQAGGYEGGGSYPGLRTLVR